MHLKCAVMGAQKCFSLGASQTTEADSHEFDVMMEEEVFFDYPTGLVTEFVCDNKLDMDGFRVAWLEQSTMRVLLPIATRHLGITDLDAHPDLKAALIAAYQA